MSKPSKTREIIRWGKFLASRMFRLEVINTFAQVGLLATAIFTLAFYVHPQYQLDVAQEALAQKNKEIELAMQRLKDVQAKVDEVSRNLLNSEAAAYKRMVLILESGARWNYLVGRIQVDEYQSYVEERLLSGEWVAMHNRERLGLFEQFARSFFDRRRNSGYENGCPTDDREDYADDDAGVGKCTYFLSKTFFEEMDAWLDAESGKFLKPTDSP